MLQSCCEEIEADFVALVTDNSGRVGEVNSAVDAVLTDLFNL
jgi:hypothetical protein